MERTPLVVDAWSYVSRSFEYAADGDSRRVCVCVSRFLYKLFQDSGLPWVYGGEYDAVVELVIRIVRAWLAVGLRPIFVFDGASFHFSPRAGSY